MRTSRPFFNFFYREFLQRENSLLFRLVSLSFLPLSLLYLLIVNLKRLFFHPCKFDFPVVSVGNITAGGTGKTTLVMYLAEKFCLMNKKVAIVMSGVGTRKDIKTGQGLDIKDSVSDFGDEAVLIGRNLPGVFIVKGANKLKLIDFAADRIKPDILLIDDGFHCYNVKKDMEFLLLNAYSPFDNGLVIPSGALREPVGSIRRADVFVINHRAMTDKIKLENLLHKVKKFGKPVFFMDYKIEKVMNSKGVVLKPEDIKGKKIVAFAGIGAPFSFFHILHDLLPETIYGIPFPDHFSYSHIDSSQIKKVFFNCRADYLLTTEKDISKVGKYFDDLPLYFLKISSNISEIPGQTQNFDEILSGIWAGKK